MTVYLVIVGIFTLIGGIVSQRLKNKFDKYSRTPISSGMSGAEVAQKMLRDYGVHDVQITQVAGRLTDHYNPGNKTVNLSQGVFEGRNAAAAAVAAHECGHAIQHAKGYAPLKLRSALVPLQNISAKLIQLLFFLFMGGMFFNLLPDNYWVGAGVCVAYGIMALFSLVTLPVEFDASKRALQWIEDTGAVTKEEYEMSKDALWWAAMTYVVAALSALVMFLYYVSILMRRR